MCTTMQLSQNAQFKSVTSNPIRPILLINAFLNCVVEINFMSHVASLKHIHNMNVLFTKRPIQCWLRRIEILRAIMIV